MTNNEVDTHTATMFAQAMLDAIQTYETLTGDLFDPTHPNARPELRRVAAQGIGGKNYKGIWIGYRKCIDQIIDRLLAHSCWTAA